MKKPFLKKSNKLSRSNTRITLLEYCEKKYFLNYYTFALKKLDHQLRETAQILKRLKSLEMRMGEKTHFLISDYLRLLQAGEASPENIENIKKLIAQEMEKEFFASKEKKYDHLDFNDQGGLSEHYYGEQVDEELPKIIERVHQNLDALIASPRGETIKTKLHHHNVYIEDPRNPNFETMKVETDKIPQLRDINIMASPDFGVHLGGEEFFILDRKSGKELQKQIGITDQIKVYALKLLLKTNKTPELRNLKIQGHEVYLPSTQSYGGQIQDSDIQDIIEKISQDTKFQKQFLINQDPLLNQPLDSHFFSRTTSLKKCESCTMRKACEMLKAFE